MVDAETHCMENWELTGRLSNLLYKEYIIYNAIINWRQEKK